MSVGHYENFPVASLLLPRPLRPAVHTLYAFARTADDLADEGTAPPAERLTALRRLQAHLDAIAARSPLPENEYTPLARRLAAVLRDHALPIEPCAALLDAFRQDVTQHRYRDYAQLHHYCQRSANPVGHLLLALYHADTPQNRQWSDHICTALQLINFAQDVAIDWQKGRIYLPQDEMAAHHVTEADIAAACQAPDFSPNLACLLAAQADRAERLLLAGAPLARALPGRIGWELRLIVLGGHAIVRKLRAVRYDVFHRRPTLRAHDWPRLLARALWAYPKA